MTSMLKVSSDWLTVLYLIVFVFVRPTDLCLFPLLQHRRVAGHLLDLFKLGDDFEFLNSIQITNHESNKTNIWPHNIYKSLYIIKIIEFTFDQSITT